MTASHTTAEPRATSPTWGRWSLAWILSTIAHLSLLLVLAVTISNAGGAGRHSGVSQGIALDSVSVSASFGADNGDAATQYFEDETSEQPADSVSDAAQATSSAATSENSATAAQQLLAEPAADPAVANLAGLVPTSSVLGGDAFGQIRDAHGLGGSGVNALTSGGAGRRTSGKPGAASTGVFGVRGDGHKFVYVFDRSASMSGYSGSPIAAAKSQLIASLKPLEQTHQFQIIFYNEQPNFFKPSGTPGKLVFATEQNKELGRKFVSGIVADGSTNHEAALMAALRMSPDVVFFLTDADEPQMTAAQLQRINRANQGSSINAIEFGYGVQADKNNFLVRLASQNGGQHVYVDISQLPPAR